VGLSTRLAKMGEVADERQVYCMMDLRGEEPHDCPSSIVTCTPLLMVVQTI
jgi:hypothetical protein